MERNNFKNTRWKNVKCIYRIKRVKVRALSTKNKVCFARAVQL